MCPTSLVLWKLDKAIAAVACKAYGGTPIQRSLISVVGAAIHASENSIFLELDKYLRLDGWLFTKTK